MSLTFALPYDVMLIVVCMPLDSPPLPTLQALPSQGLGIGRCRYRSQRCGLLRRSLGFRKRFDRLGHSRTSLEHPCSSILPSRMHLLPRHRYSLDRGVVRYRCGGRHQVHATSRQWRDRTPRRQWRRVRNRWIRITKRHEVCQLLRDCDVRSCTRYSRKSHLLSSSLTNEVLSHSDSASPLRRSLDATVSTTRTPSNLLPTSSPPSASRLSKYPRTISSSSPPASFFPPLSLSTSANPTSPSLSGPGYSHNSPVLACSRSSSPSPGT